MVCIRDELMISTVRSHVLRYRWDGSLNRDYSLDLRRIPFCMDKQVSKGKCDTFGICVCVKEKKIKAQ